MIIRKTPEQIDAMAKAGLDSPLQRSFVANGEAARKRLERVSPRQLEQREWIAACLRDDAVAHTMVERAEVRRREQLARIGIRQPLQMQLG